MDGTQGDDSLLAFRRKKVEVVAVVVDELAHPVVAVELFAIEHIDALAAVEQAGGFVTGGNDGLEELLRVAHREPSLHQRNGFVDGVREGASIEFA